MIHCLIHADKAGAARPVLGRFKEAPRAMRPGNPYLCTALLFLAALLASCGSDGTDRTISSAEEKAAACLERGDPGGALEILQDLPSGEQDEPWVLHMRGRALLARTPGGATGADENAAAEDEAEALFREALRGDPAMSEVRVDLAALLSCRGGWVEAVRILEEGQDLDPENPRLTFQTARVYLAVSEIEGALKAANAGLALAPGSPEGLLLKGRILFEGTGGKEEGLHLMRQAVEADPALPGGVETLARALTVLAIQSKARGDTEIALALAEEALRHAPGLTPALAERGTLLVQAGDLARGIDDLRRVCAESPEDGEVRTLLARTLISLGYQKLLLKDREAALSHFREAIGLDGSGVDVTVVERILANDAGAGLDTVSSGPEPSGTAGGQARTLFEEGSALLQEGRAEEAERVFRKSLELMPVNPFVHHQLGLALAMAGRIEEGESELREAVREAEEMGIALPAAYIKLAELAFRRERPDEARKILDRHDALFPDRAGSPHVLSLRELLDG
jgi:tetratricopeptide (TPR) repeat protein